MKLSYLYVLTHGEVDLLIITTLSSISRGFVLPSGSVIFGKSEHKFSNQQISKYNNNNNNNTYFMWYWELVYNACILAKYFVNYNIWNAIAMIKLFMSSAHLLHVRPLDSSIKRMC